MLLADSETVLAGGLESSCIIDDDGRILATIRSLSRERRTTPFQPPSHIG